WCMPSLYTTLAHDWQLLHRPRLAAVEFLAVLAGDPPGRIVDVAAASGEYAAFLHQRGYETYAVDVNSEMCAVARQRHPGLAGVIHGDMLEVFDLVRGPLKLGYCIGGSLCELGSVEEVSDVVAQLCDLSQPGGCVVIEGPNFDHLQSQVRRLRAETSQVDPGDVRYGQLEDDQHPQGSPNMGSISDRELRLFLSPVSAYREDGSELHFEQEYIWRGVDVPVLGWRFTAPEGEVAGELPLLELGRAQLATAVPGGFSVRWFGDWDGSDWDEQSAHTIAVLRESAN
ncbi:MAG: hypothetical protein M3R04_06720, partial [bacterium]|nr:hypothetical protein [bacterium]